MKRCVIILLILYFFCLVGCEDDLTNSGQATADTQTCYHPNTTISGYPFGVNLDPLRSDHLDQDWSYIFNDIDFLRAGHPFFLRITLRGQWMQEDVEFDDQGNPTVTYDTSEGSYYAQVKEICDYAQASNGTIHLLGILYGTPWFNAQDGSQGPGVPINVDIWKDFVRKMLLDFPEIQAWEIWNEPDLTISWVGTTTEFAELIYNPARELIITLKPGDTIVAPGWAQNKHYYSFWPDLSEPYPLFGWNGHTDDYEPDKGDLQDFFLMIGGREAFDVWGVHSYYSYAMFDFEWSAAIQDYTCYWDLWLQTLAGADYQTIEYWITEIGMETDPEGYTEEESRDFFAYLISDQFFNYYPAGDDGESDGSDPYINKIFIYELYDEYAYNNQGGFFGLFSDIGVPKLTADLYRQKIKAYYEN